MIFFYLITAFLLFTLLLVCNGGMALSRWGFLLVQKEFGCNAGKHDGSWRLFTLFIFYSFFLLS